MARKPKTYYSSYSEATQDVWDYVSEKHLIDPSDWFREVNVGGKPKVGETKRSRGITLYNKETKKQLRKTLNIQVYRMSSDRFELNYYVN